MTTEQKLLKLLQIAVDYDLNYEGLYNLITTKKRYD